MLDTWWRGIVLAFANDMIGTCARLIKPNTTARSARNSGPVVRSDRMKGSYDWPALTDNQMDKI